MEQTISLTLKKLWARLTSALKRRYTGKSDSIVEIPILSIQFPISERQVSTSMDEITPARIPLDVFTSSLRHFSYGEFDSPDLPGSGASMDISFLRRLDEVRHLCGFPFTIDRGGGFRTLAYNKELYDRLVRREGRKRIDDSAHTRGFAADIACLESWQRYKIIKISLDHGITRIGIGDNFLHLDTDPLKPPYVIWTY